MREAPHRTRTVSPEELAELRRLSGEKFADLWLFLHETGLRVSEALALGWDDVFWSHTCVDAAKVVVRESKSGSPRTVPLTFKARDVLFKRHCQHRPAPFLVDQGSVNREWSACRAAMGLAGDGQFVPHALRHTCATNLVTRGVPLAVVQRWLGHKTIAITMRYAHVGDQQVMDAVSVLEPKES
jgi:integrase